MRLSIVAQFLENLTDGPPGAVLWLTLAGAVTVWVRRHDLGPRVTRTALGAAAYFVLNAMVLASWRLFLGMLWSSDSSLFQPTWPFALFGIVSLVVSLLGMIWLWRAAVLRLRQDSGRFGS